MFEQLKSILSIPHCPYLIKRAYLNIAFELYINQVKEEKLSNDIIDPEEVSDIISRIVIPDLDLKTFYRFLEGLTSRESNDLRSSIIK